MEELHANFSDKLIVDDPRLHLKLDLSLKNQLIKKINEHSESQLAILKDEKDRVKMLEENSQIMAALDHLPLLIEDDEPRTIIENDGILKFLKGIEFMRHKLGTFDARKQSITGWFKRFELFSDLLGWSGEQRVDALAYLLENGLDRVACEVETPKYEVVKKAIIDLVTELVVIKTWTLGTWDHLYAVVKALHEHNFTLSDKRYWIGCNMTASAFAKYVGDKTFKECEKYGEFLKELLPLS